MADINGNTALWDAIASKHHSIFRILYQLTCLSDPQTGGDLLCTAAKRNDLTVMNELLKQGLNIDSKDHHGMTATKVAMAENHVEMLQLLIMNGADVSEIPSHNFSDSDLNEMLRKRETGHRIIVHEAAPSESVVRGDEDEQEEEQSWGRSCESSFPRVSLYRGHPVNRRHENCKEPGRLIRFPDSLEELKRIAGTSLSSSLAKKFHLLYTFALP